MLSERRDTMAHRSSRHRIRPIAALALEAGTTIGPRCANVHRGQEVQCLHNRPDIRPHRFDREIVRAFSLDIREESIYGLLGDTCPRHRHRFRGLGLAGGRARDTGIDLRAGNKPEQHSSSRVPSDGLLNTGRLGSSNCGSPSSAFHYDWISRARILGGHSLTQRTETAICFWPWGPR
jgi:hypothetical protein